MPTARSRRAGRPPGARPRPQAEQHVEDGLSHPVGGGADRRPAGHLQPTSAELSTDHSHRPTLPATSRPARSARRPLSSEEEGGLVVVDEDPELVDEERMAGQSRVIAHDLLGCLTGADDQVPVFQQAGQLEVAPPFWRAPRMVPSPRSPRSTSASSKPSVVLSMADSRVSASGLSFSESR